MTGTKGNCWNRRTLQRNCHSFSVCVSARCPAFQLSLWLQPSPAPCPPRHTASHVPNRLLVPEISLHLYYPDLKLPEAGDYNIGKYGLMRWEYLKTCRRWEYIRMLLAGELHRHLHEVDEECHERIESLAGMDDLKYYFIFIQIYAALCSLNIKTICANPFSILKKAERLSALPITIIYKLFQHNFLCCVPHIIYKSNLSTISAVPPTTLKNIIHGYTVNPGIVTIKKLCDGLGITLKEFFSSDIFEYLEQEIE